MQQASKREQLELDELLSDIYRGIERLPDEPATTSPSPTHANANAANYNSVLNKSHQSSQDNQHHNNYNDYHFINNYNNSSNTSRSLE